MSVSKKRLCQRLMGDVVAEVDKNDYRLIFFKMASGSDLTVQYSNTYSFILERGQKTAGTCFSFKNDFKKKRRLASGLVQLFKSKIQTLIMHFQGT